jgi:hypothetical protein
MVDIEAGVRRFKDILVAFMISIGIGSIGTRSGEEETSDMMWVESEQWGHRQGLDRAARA